MILLGAFSTIQEATEPEKKQYTYHFPAIPGLTNNQNNKIKELRIKHQENNLTLEDNTPENIALLGQALESICQEHLRKDLLQPMAFIVTVLGITLLCKKL